MKTKFITSVLIGLFAGTIMFGQDVTTVTATSYDISDNLDLKAVASIFGESKDLEDFEYRINNPKTQISNLDLNRDGKVDYLRVIESVEENTHLIVLQSVLGRDLYQDVATIEVEKDLRNNTVQVQVVGDVFLYGTNYIYEPVYYARPVIFNVFWTRGYVAYYSPWYWGYYPAYYSYWTPYPVFRYRNHVCTYVNVHNHYYYTDIRRSSRAVAIHNRTRSNYIERQNPRMAFSTRNEGYTNSYALNQTRSNANGNSTRATAVTPVNTTRSNATLNSTRSNSVAAPVNATRSNSVSTPTRVENGTRSNNSATLNTNRDNSTNNSTRMTSVAPSTTTRSSASTSGTVNSTRSTNNSSANFSTRSTQASPSASGISRSSTTTSRSGAVNNSSSRGTNNVGRASR